MKCTLVFLIIISLGYSKPSYSQLWKERKLIIGTWKSENGIHKYKFTKDGKCFEYIYNKLESISTYKISNSDFECDSSAVSSPNLTFLNIMDNKDKSVDCYIIQGITYDHFSISPTFTGGVALFYRERNMSKRKK